MAQPLETILRNKLKTAKKVVLLGVGSDLRGDDAAGMLVAGRLQRLPSNSGLKRRLKVLFGATAPENMTGEVRRFKPTHVIIVDAAQMRRRSGAIEVIEPDSIEGITFTTHQLPMNILARYLNSELGCEVIFIGIQPKTLKFGKSVSREVKTSVSKLATIIKKILNYVKVRPRHSGPRSDLGARGLA